MQLDNYDMTLVTAVKNYPHFLYQVTGFDNKLK